MKIRDKDHLEKICCATIHNVVEKSFIKNIEEITRIDPHAIKKIGKHLRDSQQVKGAWPGFIVKISSMNANINIGNKGYIGIRGTTNKEDAEKALFILKKRIEHIIKNKGMQIPAFETAKVEVSTMTIGFQYPCRIKLQSLSDNAHDFIMKNSDSSFKYKKLVPKHEPELFPAVLLKFAGDVDNENKEAGPCIFIFSTGNVNILGAKSKKHATELINIIYPLLNKYSYKTNPFLQKISSNLSQQYTNTIQQTDTQQNNPKPTETITKNDISGYFSTLQSNNEENSVNNQSVDVGDNELFTKHLPFKTPVVDTLSNTENVFNSMFEGFYDMNSIFDSDFII